MTLLRFMFTPREPTKSCPHRWCWPAHSALLIVGIVMVFMVLFSGWIAALLIPAFGVAGVLMGRASRGGKSLIEQHVEDIRTAPYLHVRRGWAFVALSMDVITVLFISVAIIGWITGLMPDYDSSIRETARAGWINSVFTFIWGLGFAWFNFYAHAKATKPRKPIRERLPVWLGGVAGAQS